MPRRLDLGSLVAGAGALLLLVSLFLEWFGPAGDGEGYTAWTVYEVIDLLLAATALLALSAIASRSGFESRAPEVPPLFLGGGALLVVVLQLLNHPPAATELDLRIGAWLALAGAALLLAGAVMSVARISLAFEQRETRTAEASATSESQPETVKLTEPEQPA